MQAILQDITVISLIFYGGIYLMIAITPRSQLHNYPKAIRDAVPPKTKSEIALTLAVGLPVLLLVTVYVIGVSIMRGQADPANYFAVFGHWLAVQVGLCAVDLLICDYLIFCTITPRFLVIPGTQGHPAYKDKRIQTRTIPQMLIVAPVLAAVCSLTYFLQ